MEVVQFDRRSWHWEEKEDKSHKPSLFHVVDKNSDGKVTKEEFQSMIDSMNTNKDE